MKKIRYAGIALSVIPMICLCVFCFTLVTSQNGWWFNLVCFIISIIPSLISINFLLWAQPLDALGKMNSTNIEDRNILDLPATNLSESAEAVRQLKKFVPLKFWIIITILLHFFTAGFITINIIEQVQYPHTSLNLGLVTIVLFLACLFLECLINGLILVRIHLRR